jgi:Sec-independent protein secretion pathway component TatC
MNRRIIPWLLRWYPAKWRAEYGSELADLIGQQPLRLATVCNVLWNALKERARQPMARALLGSGFVFFLAMVLSDPLWRLVSSPVIVVLRYQGTQPPNMVAVTPWEQLEVIYLGMPFLVATSIAWPCWLMVTWRRLTSSTARAFAVWSAALYVLCFVSGAVAWRYGSLRMLLRIMPDLPTVQVVSISHCFNLLAASTLGLAVLLQIPLVTVYQITVAIQKTRRAGHSKHP